MLEKSPMQKMMLEIKQTQQGSDVQSLEKLLAMVIQDKFQIKVPQHKHVDLAEVLRQDKQSLFAINTTKEDSKVDEFSSDDDLFDLENLREQEKTIARLLDRDLVEILRQEDNSVQEIVRQQTEKTEPANVPGLLEDMPIH